LGLVIVLTGTGCDHDANAHMAANDDDGDGTVMVGRSPGTHLRAKLDGKPVTFKSAVALSRGGRAVELTLATYKLDCDSAARGMTPFDRDKLLVTVVVSPVLRSTGAEEWTVTKTIYQGDNNARPRGAVVAKAIDPRRTVELKLPPLSLDSATKPTKTVELEGRVFATGCGERRRPGSSAKPRRQKRLTFSVAGMPLPIEGAVVERSSRGETIRLSTQPLDCEGLGVDADAVWELRRDENYAMLRGNIFTRQMSQSFSVRNKEPVVKVRSTKAGVVLIDLEGKYRQLGYDVVVSGTVKALSCTQ